MTTQSQQPESKDSTKYEKGYKFEEKVARWARGLLSKLNPVVKLNQYANGLTVKRPYQIDIHLHIKGKRLFAEDADVWVECKWKGKSSVKRTDIIKLVASAQDVYRAYDAGRNEIYYNGLILVSNQRFDFDAINYANQEDVLCVRYDGKKYEQQNETEKWLGEPGWLKRIS